MLTNSGLEGSRVLPCLFCSKLTIQRVLELANPIILSGAGRLILFVRWSIFFSKRKKQKIVSVQVLYSVSSMSNGDEKNRRGCSRMLEFAVKHSNVIPNLLFRQKLHSCLVNDRKLYGFSYVILSCFCM